MPPNLTGYYRFVSQENMDNYLRALGNSTLLIPLLPPLLLPSVSKNVRSREGEEGIMGTLWSFCLRPSLLRCGGSGEEVSWLGLPGQKSGGALWGLLLEEAPRSSTDLPSLSPSRYQRGPAKTGLPPEAR